MSERCCCCRLCVAAALCGLLCLCVWRLQQWRVACARTAAMELDAGAAPERPASPESGRLHLLQSACISLAASQAGLPTEAGGASPMERRERLSPAAGAPDGPLPGAAPQNDSADADIFFEYDTESGAAGSASGGAAGGADTGCALTSPAGGSRDLSPVLLHFPENSATTTAAAPTTNNTNSAGSPVVSAALHPLPVDAAAAAAAAATSAAALAAAAAPIADEVAVDAAAVAGAIAADAGVAVEDVVAGAVAADPADALAGAAAAAAAAEPSGDCCLGRSDAVPVPDGARCCTCECTQDACRQADRSVCKKDCDPGPSRDQDGNRDRERCCCCCEAARNAERQAGGPAEVPAGAQADAQADPTDGQAGAQAAGPADLPSGRSNAVPVPGGARCRCECAQSADRPAPPQNCLRRMVGGSLGNRPQQSPSEKVDAWLRACQQEDSGASTEEEEGAEQTQGAAAAAAESDEPQFQLEEDRASELEDSSATEEMVDALGVDDVHDLRELMARGMQLLDLEPDPETPRAGDAEDEGLPEEEELEGAVGGATGFDDPQDYSCMRGAFEPERDYHRPRERDHHGSPERDYHRPPDHHYRPVRPVPAERPPLGAEGGAVGGAADSADADADDEAASTSGASSSFAPPDQLKRSTSLKSGKTPPQTPGRKKFVRFADAMGLDLQRVHTFRDEIPTVPAAAFRGLELDMTARPPSPTPPPPATFQMSFGSAALSSGAGGAPLRQLVPMFLQPGGSLGFLDRLRRERVVLENVCCNNDEYTVNGVVRVLNMDFHKTVYVRYTLDEWRTAPELRAEYVPGSCDGLSDRFRFTLHAGALSPGERLQFVLRFECQGQQFWDNNFGENYLVQMIRSASASIVDEPGEWSGGRL
ncbi:uncharacterized protein LOC122371233 isoform X1 [Amphibalanus amphitrite]|uniref:uncharacterized protein LOC122371233 isoform X1 n=2 Tax=Amphibalanus amphitrite TaxID=1232801 RepID=UPI001C906916|nr:uncharacterized protein LOC122371233 isoform X1 [Amphibalanus amphitrite]